MKDVSRGTSVPGLPPVDVLASGLITVPQNIYIYTYTFRRGCCYVGVGRGGVRQYRPCHCVLYGCGATLATSFSNISDAVAATLGWGGVEGEALGVLLLDLSRKKNG